MADHPSDASQAGPAPGNRIVASLFAIETALDTVSIVAMFVMMLVLVADALGRYFFTYPLPWAHDLVSRLLLPAAFFFTLSSALRVNQHVHIDILIRKLGPRGRNIAMAAGTALGSVLFFNIAWLGARVAFEAYNAGERMSGSIEWPVWVYSAFVPLGLAPLVVRLALRSFESVRRVLRHEAPLDDTPRDDESAMSF